MSTVIDPSTVTTYGPSRSMVRMIATRLPIDTGQRIYIQLPHIVGSHPPSPSGSNGGMFDLTSLLKDPSMLLGKQFSLESIDEEEAEHVAMEIGNTAMSQEAKACTTKRITSLEAELARLKAQIATYALNEVENMEAPPPPPPPPLPPLLPSLSNSDTATSTTTSLSGGVEATPTRPPLGHVLKDIRSVQLKTVDMERSPGGTPLRPKRSSLLDPPSLDDPAAIIAHALRKKFSHKVFQDSPDKENLDRSETSFNEFDSPISGTPTSKTLQFESPT